MIVAVLMDRFAAQVYIFTTRFTTRKQLQLVSCQLQQKGVSTGGDGGDGAGERRVAFFTSFITSFTTRKQLLLLSCQLQQKGAPRVDPRRSPSVAAVLVPAATEGCTSGGSSRG